MNWVGRVGSGRSTGARMARTLAAVLVFIGSTRATIRDDLLELSGRNAPDPFIDITLPVNPVEVNNPGNPRPASDEFNRGRP